VRNLNSDIKAYKERSVLLSLSTVWWLDGLKRIEKIILENSFEQKKKKSGLKFNPGLPLIGLRTTRPRHQSVSPVHVGNTVVKWMQLNYCLYNVGWLVQKCAKLAVRKTWTGKTGIVDKQFYMNLSFSRLVMRAVASHADILRTSSRLSVCYAGNISCTAIYLQQTVVTYLIWM